MFKNSLKMLLTGGRTNRKSRDSSDGGNEDTIDLQSASLDPLHNFTGQGGSIDSDGAFEGDYAVPPLSMAEGLQHIRIMEGVSRSLPSSPLLTHQTSSSRLPSVRKVFGTATGTKRFAKPPPVAIPDNPCALTPHIMFSRGEKYIAEQRGH